MAGPYLIGNVIRLRGVWTDPNNSNVPIDPTTVTFRYADPTGNVTAFTYPTNVVKEAVGIYHLDVSANISGLWWYDAVSTGTAQARMENNFLILASKVQP